MVAGLLIAIPLGSIYSAAAVARALITLVTTDMISATAERNSRTLSKLSIAALSFLVEEPICAPGISRLVIFALNNSMLSSLMVLRQDWF